MGLVELTFWEDEFQSLNSDSDENTEDTSPPDPGFVHSAEFNYWIGCPIEEKVSWLPFFLSSLSGAGGTLCSLERIDAAVYSTWKEASRRVLGRLGFVGEGCLRGGVRQTGGFGDIEVFAAYRVFVMMGVGDRLIRR
jgi:hypothetical protein